MLGTDQRELANFFALMASTPILECEAVPSPTRLFVDLDCPRFEEIEGRSRATLAKRFDRIRRERRRQQSASWGSLS